MSRRMRSLRKISRRMRSLRKISKRSIKNGHEKNYKKRSSRMIGGSRWRRSTDNHKKVYEKIKKYIYNMPAGDDFGCSYTNKDILDLLEFMNEAVIEEIKQIPCEATEKKMENCKLAIEGFVIYYVRKLIQTHLRKITYNTYTEFFNSKQKLKLNSQPNNWEINKIWF